MGRFRFTIAGMSDVAHPDAWRDDRLVLDLAECPGERLLPRQSRPRRFGTASSWFPQDLPDRVVRHRSAVGADAHTTAEGTGRGRQRPRSPAPGCGADRPARQRVGRAHRLRPRGTDVRPRACLQAPGTERRHATAGFAVAAVGRRTLVRSLRPACSSSTASSTRPTCYCPQRDHGNRRETTAAPPDTGPHRRHAARRQRHPGGDRQRLHDRETRDRGDRPRGPTTWSSVRWLPTSSACIRTTSAMSPAGGASRRRSHRDAGSVLDASYPSTAPTYTSKRFKAALAEVRDRDSWSRHAALDGALASVRPRDPSGPTPVKIPAAPGVL